MFNEDWPEIGELDESVGGTVWCPQGGEPIPAMRTAYGHRAVCAQHKGRWTRLDSETLWVRETYTTMTDNNKER